MKICKECGRKYSPYNKRQKYCSTKCKFKYYNKNRRKELKKQQRILAIKSLGNKCQLCETEDMFFLCLDHINDDGYKDKEKWTSDSVRNRWIIKNPNKAKKIFQILCYNCNGLKQNNREEYDRRLNLK